MPESSVMPRFATGARVRISARSEGRHHRVPSYAKGRIGVIERVCGAYDQPELIAYRYSGEPLQTLYSVRLKQEDLWSDYEGACNDTLEIEIFEHWLEPA